MSGTSAPRGRGILGQTQAHWGHGPWSRRGQAPSEQGWTGTAFSLSRLPAGWTRDLPPSFAGRVGFPGSLARRLQAWGMPPSSSMAGAPCFRVTCSFAVPAAERVPRCHRCQALGRGVLQKGVEGPWEPACSGFPRGPWGQQAPREPAQLHPRARACREATGKDTCGLSTSSVLWKVRGTEVCILEDTMATGLLRGCFHTAGIPE